MKRNNTYLVVVVLLLAMLQLLLSKQGFDMTDEGWMLNFYRCFFNDITNEKYALMYYLTGFIGGVWHCAFGSIGGIYGFRILNILVLSLISIVTYRTVKGFLKHIHVYTFATTFVVLMSYDGLIIFEYNFMTSLLVAISCYYLIKSIQSDKNYKQLLMLSGVFIGLSFFARLSNLVFLVLSGVFLVDYAYHNKPIRLLNSFLYGGLGVFLGIAVVSLLQYSLGHFSLFYKTIIEDVISAGSSTNSNHNLSSMLFTYYREYKSIAIHMFQYTGLFIVFVFLFRKLKHIILKIFLIFLVFCFLMKDEYYTHLFEYYYAFLLMSLIASTKENIKNKRIIVSNVVAVLVMFLMPLGSDHGIDNLGARASWLASFLAFNYYYGLFQKYKNTHRIAIPIVLSLFGFVILFKTLVIVENGNYFDNGSRNYKFYQPDNNLANVYTTREKGIVLNDLLFRLQEDSNLNQGDTLFCFQSLPTINYLTKTAPFMGCSWPWVYDPVNFDKQLRKSEKNATTLPLVLRQKCQPLAGRWTKFDKKYNDTLLENNWGYKKERIASFERFLKRNNYEIVWETTLFQFLESKTGKK